MTEQQKQFAQEYVKLRCRHGAGKQAAIAAGYSEKTAAAKASNLLKKDEIKKYIEELKGNIEAELREEFLFDAKEARQALYEIAIDGDADPRARVNAAKDLLDRAGFKPKDKQEISMITPVIIDDISGGENGC